MRLKPTMETRCGWGWEWGREDILDKGSPGKDTKEEPGGSEHGKGHGTADTRDCFLPPGASEMKNS